MKLSDLRPGHHASPVSGVDARMHFLCPKCRRGVVIVDVVLGEQKPGVHAHATTALPPEWDRMSVRPSIAAEGTCNHCPGWHGFITDGEAAP